MAMETWFLQPFHLFVTNDDIGRQLILSVSVIPSEYCNVVMVMV